MQVKYKIGGAQMSNEEFQRIVLEELRGLKEGQGSFSKELRGLKEEQRGFSEELRGLKEEQIEMRKEIKAITEQTAILTEFREESNAKLDKIIEENDIFKELIGKHEVDIRRLQRRIV